MATTTQVHGTPVPDFQARALTLAEEAHARRGGPGTISHVYTALLPRPEFTLGVNYRLGLDPVVYVAGTIGLY